ncbi:sensor histidine kinase [Frankia sp. CNm7]|uniref:histidine kinase n=1 Tax=Frankia nepalensis TaxID=1836974 RepID=A0A937RGD5_9ACTN|nr:sensor histidine kinase [Frankia nepalensis]MBL7496477.1 sensor histidine kinase [Frankia nepalensis]MBL7515291.1 sensor histidine kinase [Frankia nepalensis]MBL7521922.1 sensor histidine kinase [Frankia nepalensis]MBL7625883.1 sensor histidine kinase [Frankia nepalensis]
MTSLAPGGLALKARAARALWAGLRATYSRRSWLATVFAAQTTVLGTVSFATVFAFAVGGGASLFFIPVSLPLLWVGLTLARRYAQFESWRFAAFLGDELRLRPVPVPGHLGSGRLGRAWARMWARLRSGGSWLEGVYALFVLPLVGWIGGWIVATLWGGGLAFVLFPAYAPALGRADRLVGLDLGYGGSVATHAVVGVAALLAAPWVARGLAALQLATARKLLSPSPTAALTQRVAALETSRAGMVTAAAAERRRIERDLHDGAQQRLVGVAMTLGRAQERFADDPGGARDLVAEAHAETKRALVELRDLARGLHPAVLTDRGLDAALAGLAARCPVPVTLQVEVTPRPTAEVEAVAYFFVAEALTNVARHADATAARIVARRSGDRLEVEVSDDGRGGAAEDTGSGLTGLRDRALAVDGAFSVRSAPGTGTTLRMDLPCQN